jgi:hypothetical protein
MTILRRYPLITFFVLTYVVAWGFLPFSCFGAFAPLVAVLIVVPITHGRTGLHELRTRMIRWRVGWIWYALAAGLPLAVHLLTVTLNLTMGAPAPSLS